MFMLSRYFLIIAVTLTHTVAHTDYYHHRFSFLSFVVLLRWFEGMLCQLYGIFGENRKDVSNLNAIKLLLPCRRKTKSSLFLNFKCLNAVRWMDGESFLGLYGFPTRSERKKFRARKLQKIIFIPFV